MRACGGGIVGGGGGGGKFNRSCFFSSGGRTGRCVRRGVSYNAGRDANIYRGGTIYIHIFLLFKNLNGDIVLDRKN